ncbi:MAG: UDP-N-acetylmuramoyl-L-alanine--D-glutamate ligase [Phycisphaerales bacterium]|nr:MAG: UDP-N-acetylmuramoyl-L-alanine--D-glutamate ligase [Phycisphaerales bacterium]
MNKELLSGKKVLVMGLGRFGGGSDVVNFAHCAGAKVIVTDLASAEQLSDSVRQIQTLDGVEFHLGSHEPTDFEQADVIIANPAVPCDNEFLQIARRAGNLVTSQMNIFFDLCPARIIGITGANGKSTTAALTAHLLKNTISKHIWLSGNIGNQPLLTTIGQISPEDLVVLELSSFQLEQLAEIQRAPSVALLTNLTPNHLDRHGTFANYCAAKENIFKFQQISRDHPAVSVFNVEDKIAAAWFEKYRKDAGRICIGFSADDVSEEIRSVLHLPGRANLSNLAAAMAIARYFGIHDEQIKFCLSEFKALAHRLELVAQINGVSWYNDSKATTPEGATTALNAFEKPTIIIAGGYDKNIPFGELGEKIAQKAKAAILIGATAPKIAEAIRLARGRGTRDEGRRTKIETMTSLADAVQLANRLSEPGDVVLLSPACASYDMFENYEQRGREFAKLVRTLVAEKASSQA